MDHGERLLGEGSGVNVCAYIGILYGCVGRCGEGRGENEKTEFGRMKNLYLRKQRHVWMSGGDCKRECE